MMKTLDIKYVRKGIVVIRSIAVYFLFALSSFLLSGMAFDDYTVVQEVGEKPIHICALIFWALIINSFVLAANNNDIIACKEYNKTKASDFGFFGIMKDIFKSVDYYIEAGIIVFFCFSMSSSFTFKSLGGLMYGDGYGEKEQLTVKLLGTFLVLVIELAANYMARRVWLSNDEDDGKKSLGILKTLKAFIIAGVAYFLAGSLISALIKEITNPVTYWLILAFLVIVVAVNFAIYLFNCVRAISLRRKFLKNLTETCKEAGAILSPVKRPILSIFNGCEDESFTLTTKKDTYRCKLIAGISSNSPMIFRENGIGAITKSVRFLKLDIFKRDIKFDYAIEGDGKKLLIIVPIPKKIYVEEGDMPRREADVGEKIWEYTIYNGSGFTGYIDRNLI